MHPSSRFGLAAVLLAVGGAAACNGSTTVFETSGTGGGGRGGAGGDPSVASGSISSGGSGGVGGEGGAVVSVGSTANSSSSSSSSSSSAASSSSSGGVDPWAGPIEALKELDLGDQTLGFWHNFPIPDKTIGFTLLVNAPSNNEVIGIAELKPPVGISLIKDYAMAAHATQVFGGLGWIAGADPQTDIADAWPVKKGNWQYSLGDDDGSISKGHVSLWVRRTSDGQFHGGVMDVNVFIAPGVASQGYMTQALNAMFSVDYAGITLGDVNWFSLPASATVISTDTEYRQIIQSSAGVGTVPALNLFVVQDFSDNEFGQAFGIAAGIPGSPMKHGTMMSGVAYAPTGDAVYDGTVLRHEIGHLGGLFHTTEFQFNETDPITDTPVCPSNTIANQPNNCPDFGNMMFPISYGANAITPAQAIVLRGSGLYRGIIDAGGSPALPIPGPPGLDPSIQQVPSGAAWVPVTTVRPAKALPASPTPLQAVLGGVWCSHAHGDLEGLAIRIAGPGGAALHQIALDGSLPGFMRGRALGAWIRAQSPRDAALAEAEAIAAAEGEPTDLRVAALRALARFDRARAGKAGALAQASGDAVVRAVGLRLGHP